MTAAFAMKDRLRVAIALALAATAAGTASAADTTGGLEEVTVTATRRVETNLQETPISVSAVTSGDIERMVAKDISGIASSVPGFSAARVTAFNAASFAMRGVGITDIIVYQDSPVGVQVDDFVMPSVQTQLLDTFDIAGVEVLRGPQGTLFGKNTTGGAVQIRTKRPDMKEFGADLRVGAAKFGEMNGQVGLDIPVIADKLSFRVAASYVKSDGYYRLGASYGPINTFNTNPAFGAVGAPFTIPGITGQRGTGTGERAGGQDVFYGRLKMQWNITDDLTALVQYENMRDRSDAVPSFNDTPPGGPYLWNALGFTRPTGDPLNNMASTNRQDSLLKMADGQVIDVDGAYLNLDWRLNEHYTLYSNTGFRTQFEHLPNTYTGAAPVNTVTNVPLSLFDASRDTQRNTMQQEIRIASSLDGPINYVAGGFWQRNDAIFCVTQSLGFVDLIQNFGAAGLPQQFLNNAPQLLCNKQKSDSLAGFVDGTWNVTDKLQFGAGFRYTRDEKEWSGRTQTFYSGITANGSVPNLSEPLDGADFAKYPGAPASAANCAVSLANKDTVLRCTNGTVLDFSNLSRKWTEPSWRFTASYKWSEDLFGYATVSRGYKAGGYNDQTGTSGILVPQLTRPVDPEFATNYEIGLKTQWLDNRLRFNPTIYYTKYSDAQRAANVIARKGGADFQETVFYNAAKVTSKGAELELQYAPTQSFRLRAAAAYLDAKYDTFTINQPQIGNPATGDGIVGVSLNLSGLPVPRSPKFSGSVMGTYTAALADKGNLEFTGELFHEDKNLYYISAAGRAYDAYLDSKTLFNAAAAWTSSDGVYFARLYGRNLTDRRYRIASQSVATLWVHSQFGEPRNYGVQLGMKFGSAMGR